MYDRYEIDGGYVELPGGLKETATIINTGDKLWVWDSYGGTYLTIYIEDGVPVTEGVIKPEKPEDKKVKKKWNADFK